MLRGAGKPITVNTDSRVEIICADTMGNISKMMESENSHIS